MRSAMTDGLSYDVYGEAGLSQPTVFLSSGLGGAAAYWRLQTPMLVAAGFNVIAYDQRGTGRSASTLPADYTIDHMADDVLRILEHSQTRRCHFVGHALGGLVGMALALKAPDRVASLSLINAWSKIRRHTLRCFEARLSLLECSGVDAYVRAQPLFLYPAAWSETHYQDIEAEVMHAIRHFPGAEIMTARIDALKRFDVQDRLGELTMPAWVSAAQDDVLVPWTASQELAAALPNAQFDLAPTGGHAHNQTAPEAFNTRLQAFLNAASHPLPHANN